MKGTVPMTDLETMAKLRRLSNRLDYQQEQIDDLQERVRDIEEGRQTEKEPKRYRLRPFSDAWAMVLSVDRSAKRGVEKRIMDGLPNDALRSDVLGLSDELFHCYYEPIHATEPSPPTGTCAGTRDERDQRIRELELQLEQVTSERDSLRDEGLRLEELDEKAK